MNKYQVLSAGTIHTLEAVTFTQAANELRFVGASGAIVAIFAAFDWMKVVPAEAPAKDESTTETAAAEASGE